MSPAKQESIQLDHLYPKSPPSMVWKALTEPELLARWWAPGDVRPVVGWPGVLKKLQTVLES